MSEAFFQTGNTAFQQAKWTQALSEFGKIPKNHRRYSESNNLKGEIYFQLGNLAIENNQWEKAFDQFLRVPKGHSRYQEARKKIRVFEGTWRVPVLGAAQLFYDLKFNANSTNGTFVRRWISMIGRMVPPPSHGHFTMKNNIITLYDRLYPKGEDAIILDANTIDFGSKVGMGKKLY